MSIDNIQKALTEAHTCLTRLMNDTVALEAIESASQAMVHCLKSGGKILSCGNGGSMCDAMHFTEELSGRFRQDRPALAALSISEPGFITCAANDFGYEHIFSRFCEAMLTPKDLLLAISTSGKSPNVLAAAKYASGIGATVIGLTGRKESALEACSDVCVITPGSEAGWADRVQEQHIKVIHIWIELIETAMFGK